MKRTRSTPGRTRARKGRAFARKFRASKHAGYRRSLAPLELEAAARLLSYWARPENIEKRPNIWSKRLPALRAMMQVGLEPDGSDSARTLEGIPHELVADEYAVVLRAVQWAKKELKAQPADVDGAWLLDISVPFKVREEICIHRQFPCPPERAEQIVEKLIDERSSHVAHELTGLRLAEISESTVKKANAAAAEDRLRKKRTTAQRFLASVFLDFCSYSDQRSDMQVMCKILDELARSGYPPILLYYLVQVGQKSFEAITPKLIDENAIEGVFNVLPKRIEDDNAVTSFANLLEGGARTLHAPD